MRIYTYTPKELPYINEVIKSFVINTHFDDGYNYGLKIVTLKTKQGNKIDINQDNYIKIRTLRGVVYIDIYDTKTSECIKNNIRLK